MQRYKAIVAYDGAAYFGFQRQREGQPSIQSALERALRRIFNAPTPIVGAGRTDTGVHALGQVISFTAVWRNGDAALLKAINANLPPDIAILQLEETVPSFHPRYDARQRAYVYRIYNAPVRSPLERDRSWHVKRPLHLQAMQQAARHLIGQHDFATFGRPPQGINTVRELFTAQWEQKAQMLEFHVAANAFLYRMVRSIVGSLKLVGTGVWTVTDFVDALHACDRSRSGKVAPPQGLYLLSVQYESTPATAEAVH